VLNELNGKYKAAKAQLDDLLKFKTEATAANDVLTATISAIRDDEEVMQTRIAEKSAEMTTDQTEEMARWRTEIAKKHERLKEMVADRDQCRQAVEELEAFRLETAGRLEDGKQRVLGLVKAAKAMGGAVGGDGSPLAVAGARDQAEVTHVASCTHPLCPFPHSLSLSRSPCAAVQAEAELEVRQAALELKVRRPADLFQFKFQPLPPDGTSTSPTNLSTVRRSAPRRCARRCPWRSRTPCLTWRRRARCSCSSTPRRPTPRSETRSSRASRCRRALSVPPPRPLSILT